MDPDGDFELIWAIPPERIAQLHALYQNEWWTRDRTLEETARGVAGSTLNLGLVVRETNVLAGYARVLSDLVFKAGVYDVIVHPDFRGRDLGARLMDAILAHPSLAGVRHFELYCLPELAAFYARWGFTADLGALQFMRRTV